MSTNFIETFEQTAASVLDTIADAVVGKAAALRDGTEHRGVELPRDLYAHDAAQTEWWYYTGHMETARGRRFGFELVFFKRRTDLDRFGVVPLRLIANPLYFAHFGVTDESRQKFRYDHRKSARGMFDLPAVYSAKRYYLRLGDWTVREAHGLHLLRATLGDDLIFEVALKP
ncbi:MAG: carotenoid 1,2-hydratase, partial [Pyrinomonadaceae bacterium]|nr:carotenoid 1,2-hydratase [Pyrinomonadaceae bacterium]